jgi:hypothetical protein
MHTGPNFGWERLGMSVLPTTVGETEPITWWKPGTAGLTPNASTATLTHGISLVIFFTFEKIKQKIINL